MATQDIMPYDSAHGGHERIVHFHMADSVTDNTTNTSWRAGEVLIQVPATGEISVIADGIENVLVTHYIAAAGSADLIQYHNSTSGAATHAIMVPCYPITGNEGGTFITENAVTSSDTLLTAAQMDALFVGDTVGLWRDNTATGVANNGENGTFSVNSAGTGLQLIRKLDALGREGIEGRIVVYAVPWQGYGKTVGYRGKGASRAAEYGAVAALVRNRYASRAAGDAKSDSPT